jgi:hypothetical protein
MLFLGPAIPVNPVCLVGPITKSQVNLSMKDRKKIHMVKYFVS